MAGLVSRDCHDRIVPTAGSITISLDHDGKAIAGPAGQSSARDRQRGDSERRQRQAGKRGHAIDGLSGRRPACKAGGLASNRGCDDDNRRVAGHGIAILICNCGRDQRQELSRRHAKVPEGSRNHNLARSRRRDCTAADPTRQSWA